MYTILFLIMLITFVSMCSNMAYRSIKGSARAKELGGNMEPSENNDEPLACDMLVTRVFEQRMVEAGIMTVAEMSVCDTPIGLCKDCAPTHQAREAIKKEALLKEQAEREALVKKKMKELNAIKPKEASKRARQGDLKLHIEHNGTRKEFEWPKQIPTYASVKVDTNHTYQHTVMVVFKWTDADTGRQLAHKVMFPMLEWGGGFTGPKERKPGTSGLTPKRRKAAVDGLTKRDGLYTGM